jgi:hypothetical protein
VIIGRPTANGTTRLLSEIVNDDTSIITSTLLSRTVAKSADLSGEIASDRVESNLIESAPTTSKSGV